MQIICTGLIDRNDLLMEVVHFGLSDVVGRYMLLILYIVIERDWLWIEVYFLNSIPITIFLHALLICMWLNKQISYLVVFYSASDYYVLWMK